MGFNRTAVFVVILAIVLAIFMFFIIRMLGAREIDDVNPFLCSETDFEYLNKSEILWVVPLFGNISINDNPGWIDEIKSLNKTLGLHGVYHTYNEFGTERTDDYLNEGVREFEEAFGFKPLLFKAPQLNLSKGNRELLLRKGFMVKGKWNQFIHKVYHCNDSDVFKNRMIGLF